MNTFIQRATAIQTEHAAINYCLPDNFPYLVSIETGKIIECVLFFLCDTCLQRNVYVGNTAVAFANDIKDWWDFLQHFSVDWKDADIEHVKKYRDAMFCTISPHTHKPYSRSTIKRRVGTVISFYRWAKVNNLVSEDVDVLVAKRIMRTLDSDLLAHIPNKQDSLVSDVIPRSNRAPDECIRPFSPSDYRRVAVELGPLPSEIGVSGKISRDRLAAEIALNTGMRVSEVASLTIWHILDLRPDREMPLGATSLFISNTKGGRSRRVLMPNWLIDELLLYIDGERKSTIVVGRRWWLKGKVEPRALFLNNKSAAHNSGKAIKKKSLQDAFHNAVMRAKLVSRSFRRDPISSTDYVVSIADHSFHDLRHSYAVWTYHARLLAGDAQPWKFIQTMLGHAYMSTTINTYLRVVDIFESVVSDRMMSYFIKQSKS